MSKFVLTLATAVLCCVTFDSFASPILDDEDKAVRYRQSAYYLLRTNVGPLAAMARGKRDYDAELFKTYARKVGMLAEFPQDGFAEQWSNSDSKAKDDIWENKADFDQKMTDFIEAAKAMAKTAESGDKSANVKAFMAMGKTCKACHDKYKAD